jgi:arginase family enzyme
LPRYRRLIDPGNDEVNTKFSPQWTTGPNLGINRQLASLRAGLPLERVDPYACHTIKEPMTKQFAICGVPTSAGGNFTGTEAAPAAYRSAGLLEALSRAGVHCRDDGDVPLPAGMLRHDVAPIRNWPSPRIAWQAVASAVAEAAGPTTVPLLVGGDCSIVVGTVSGLLSRPSGRSVHLLYIDGHIDAVAPRADASLGAAAMGLWLLTTASAFVEGSPLISPDQVTVLGCVDRQGSTHLFNVVDANELASKGAGAAVRNALQSIGTDVDLVLHLDVDVLAAKHMPSAYSPNPRGVDPETLCAVLGPILADERLAVVEVVEYPVQRDLDGRVARWLVDLLTQTIATNHGAIRRTACDGGSS